MDVRILRDSSLTAEVRVCKPVARETEMALGKISMAGNVQCYSNFILFLLPH